MQTFFALFLQWKCYRLINLQYFYKINIKYKVSRIKSILWYEIHIWYLRKKESF